MAKTNRLSRVAARQVHPVRDLLFVAVMMLGLLVSFGAIAAESQTALTDDSAAMASCEVGPI